MIIETLHETVQAPVQPPRHDAYRHVMFNEVDSPELVEEALRIHAEGYHSMGFVKESAIDEDGRLKDSIDHSRGIFTDYFLAINPDNADDCATMRKINLPPGGSYEDLPAYQLCKDGLFPESIAYFAGLEQQDIRLKEIAGLARARHAKPTAVYEILRGAIQESLGKHEIWFFSIVSTTYDTLAANLGKDTLAVLGADVTIKDGDVEEGISLRPAATDMDMFLDSVLASSNQATTRKQKARLQRSLLFFSEGLRDDQMSADVVAARKEILDGMNSSK